MTEAKYWPTVADAWRTRAKSLGLKPKSKGYKAQQEAYLQGVLAVATATGVMSMDRANMLALLVMCGRIDSVLPFEEQETAVA